MPRLPFNQRSPSVPTMIPVMPLKASEREAANRIPEFIEYVELSGRGEFNDIFTDELAFPREREDDPILLETSLLASPKV